MMNQRSIAPALAHLLVCASMFTTPGCADEGQRHQEEPDEAGDGGGNNGDEDELRHLADIGLQCHLSPEFDTGGVRLTMALDNVGDDVVEFLLWNTAWDTDQEVLRVRSPEGAAPVYVGAFEPHGKAEDGTFLEVPAGESVDIQYDLSDQYEHLAGNLSVGLLSRVIGVRIDGEVEAFRHDCGDVTFPLEGSLDSFRDLLGYTGTCTTSQEAELDRMLPIVEKATFAAARHAGRDTPLFVKYFGQWTNWKGDEVAWHYNSTNGDWVNEPIRCGSADCEPKWLAFATDWDENIYFCPSQWGREILAAGTDSSDWGTMVGTTIHEYTHITGIDRSGSDWDTDWAHGGDHPYETADMVDIGQCLGGPEGNTCYGPILSVSLAQDPTCSGSSATCKAMWNAANYEFYAQEVYRNVVAVTAVL